jgi:hypothetical protein
MRCVDLRCVESPSLYGFWTIELAFGGNSGRRGGGSAAGIPYSYYEKPQ